MVGITFVDVDGKQRISWLKKTGLISKYLTQNSVEPYTKAPRFVLIYLKVQESVWVLMWVRMKWFFDNLRVFDGN